MKEIKLPDENGFISFEAAYQITGEIAKEYPSTQDFLINTFFYFADMYDSGYPQEFIDLLNRCNHEIELCENGSVDEETPAEVITESLTPPQFDLDKLQTDPGEDN